MQPHYVYERSLRRSAVTLLINILVLLVLFFAAHRWLEPTEAGRQMLFWIDIVVPVVSVGLFVLAAYFWHKNEAFRIAVDDTRFEIVEPLFTGASFSVPVSDIVEIRQIHQKMSDHNVILMRMKSGEKHQITMNRSFDRRKLYAALAGVNPAIQLPEHPLRFKQV